jgi:hypothetical protein
MRKGAAKRRKRRRKGLVFSKQRGDITALALGGSTLNPPQCCACQGIGSTRSRRAHRERFRQLRTQFFVKNFLNRARK